MTRDFYFYLGSRFASATGMMLLRSSLAWHVYSLTHSPFHLGMIGLVQFAPSLVLTLFGGAAADSYDRRRIIGLSQLVGACVGASLLYFTHEHAATLTLLYCSAFALSCAGAFESPARAALLPSMVSRDVFARAVTIASTNQALAFASGPALGGLVIASFGIAAAYACYLALITCAFFSVLALRAGAHDPSAPRREVSLAAIREGLSFVWSRPVVLGCMALDMFAVIFGGASALLPIYANEILHVGPRGYGLLTSSLELGALAMSILLMLRRPIESAGRTLLATVAVFGLATILFGLSRSFPLSIAAYMLVGMADQVSVVLRATAVQLSTPDALRGRVSAVGMIFIGASNQLGAMESGFVAALTTPTFAVVSGGVGCLIVVAVVALHLPELRRYRFGAAAQ